MFAHKHTLRLIMTSIYQRRNTKLAINQIYQQQTSHTSKQKLLLLSVARGS
jgi:hypothetical protein